MEKIDTIIRVLKDHDADPFARIDKVPINDENLSFKAKGILAYVLSKPDGWVVNITDLVNHATDGEKAVRSGIKELINLKYCSQVKKINKKTGRVIKWIYVFYERPYPGNLLPIKIWSVSPLPQNGKVVDSPLSGFPQVENGPPINNRVKITKGTPLKKKGINNSNIINIKDIDKIIAAADIQKKYKKEFIKIKTSIINMGWAGSWDDIVKNYLEKPDYVMAWVKHIQSSPGLRNPAGLLRHGLRSGQMPVNRDKVDRNKYQDDIYAEFIENA